MLRLGARQSAALSSRLIAPLWREAAALVAAGTTASVRVATASTHAATTTSLPTPFGGLVAAYHSRRAYVTDFAALSETEHVKEYSIDDVWTMWNEGNLFSMSVQEISLFLTKQRIILDPKWKKAALVRQVEEFMQTREDEKKGKPKQSASAADANADGDKFGAWDKTAGQTRPMETLLDLNQAGFYENGSVTLAPRAFQLFVGDATQDLVVSRLNTTAFPGFPASAECYTLSAADATQSAMARYTKTLHWCQMNMRNASMVGEIHVEFGKLLVMQSVLKKKSPLVACWTLQQRLQNANPMHWVGCASIMSAASIETFLASNGFVPQPKETLTYDVTVRRAKGNLSLKLNSNGAATEVHRPWEFLQRTNLTRVAGVDIRLLTRARSEISAVDQAAMMKSPIADVKADPIKALLPSNLGEIIYVSENDVRKWTKTSCVGSTLTISETKREPLMVTQDEEQGFRLEYAITVAVPDKLSADLSALGAEVFALAKEIALKLDEGFLAEFKTTTTELDTSTLDAK